MAPWDEEVAGAWGRFGTCRPLRQACNVPHALDGSTPITSAGGVCRHRLARFFAIYLPFPTTRSWRCVPAPACKEISSRAATNCGGRSLSLPIWANLCSTGVTSATQGKDGWPGPLETGGRGDRLTCWRVGSLASDRSAVGSDTRSRGWCPTSCGIREKTRGLRSLWDSLIGFTYENARGCQEMSGRASCCQGAFLRERGHLG